MWAVEAGEGPVGPGDNVVGGSRSDDLRKGSGENSFRGRATVTEYLGKGERAEVELTSGDILQVRTDQRLQPGQQVELTVAEDRIMVFPA